MSNLTDLLPAGAGGKQVSFVASGTLSSGQAVVLKTDGTVEAISQSTGTITNYTESSATSSYTATEQILRYDPFNNKVLYFYRENNGYPTGSVGSISGNTITFGTPTIANSNYRDHIAADVTTGQYANGKGIMTMIDSSDATVYATQFTVSGSSISFTNISYVYYPAHTGYGRAIAVENCPTQGNFVCTYLDQYTGNGYALPISVGASSPNIYSASEFDSTGNQANEMDMAWDSANQKMVLAYRWNNSTGKTVVITVGSSSLSYGTTAEHASAAAETQTVTYDSASGKVLLVYADGSNTLYGRVGTVSGTSISFGTAASIYNGQFGSTEYDVCYDSVNERCILSFRKNAAPNSQYNFIVAIQISGTSFTVGTDTLLRAANAQYITNVYDPSAERVVTGYRDTGNTNQPYTILSSVQTSNYTDFIGISDAAISDTASGSVTIKGGISTNVTGLTPNALYYVQADGSLQSPTASAPYAISSASYDDKSFDVSNGGTNPRAIVFNTNGTKMFVSNQTTFSIYEYDLATAFDVSTAVYNSVSFNYSSQGTGMTGLAFNNDGTKMFAVDYVSASVYQYSLSAAFDLSTISYDSVNFSISAQDSSAQGLAFSVDGTKMFVVGNTGDSVYQYSLSSSFDLSTASYDSISFSISSQETSPTEVTFNSSGTKMFILGTANDTIFQYSLSTAYDVSTASYDSISFSVSSQDLIPQGFCFSPIGTKIYVVGSTNETVYQYSTGVGSATTVLAGKALSSTSINLDYTT